MAGDLTNPATAARMLPALQRELRHFHLAADVPLLLAQFEPMRHLLGCKRVPAVDAAGAAVKLTKLQALQSAANDLVAAVADSAAASAVRLRSFLSILFIVGAIRKNWLDTPCLGPRLTLL